MKIFKNLETFDKELYERDLRENIRAEVKKENILELISKKLARGKSIEEIADALEEDIETVKKLIEELKEIK